MAESLEDVEPLVTRCPECGTRFRVTETQLQMAAGRVRCGSCLTVFFGTDHLQWDLELAAATSDPAETLDELLKEIDVFESGDVARAREALIPTEPLEAEGFGESAVGATLDGTIEPAADSADPAPWTDHGVASQAAAAGENADPEPVEGSVSEAPVPPPVEARVAAGVVPLVVPLNVPVPGSAPVPIVATVPDRFVRLWEEQPETRTDELSSPAGSAAAEAEPPAGETASAAATETGAGDAAVAPESAAGPRVAGRRPGRPGVRLDTAAGVAGPPAGEPGGARDAPFGTPIDEPQTAKPRRRVRWLALPMALVLITVQVVWYFFPAWTADPAMRWLPERFCGIAGCELAPLKALDQLLITDVLLRTDPDRASQRIVNVLLVNTAPFEQAFPEVEVAFRAPTGDLVAWKRFHPNDYLGPELQLRPIIPAKTPVRIELAIEDPGTQSYGYEISLK